MSLGRQPSHNQQGKVRKELSGPRSVKNNLFVKNKLSGNTKVKYQVVYWLTWDSLNVRDDQVYMLLLITVLWHSSQNPVPLMLFTLLSASFCGTLKLCSYSAEKTSQDCCMHHCQFLLNSD